jgi:hypothetical protein
MQARIKELEEAAQPVVAPKEAAPIQTPLNPYPGIPPNLWPNQPWYQPEGWRPLETVTYIGDPIATPIITCEGKDYPQSWVTGPDNPKAVPHSVTFTAASVKQQQP